VGDGSTRVPRPHGTIVLAAQSGLIQLGGKPPLRHYLQTIWNRREFAIAIASGDLRAQHMDTALGNLWHVLNPLMLVAVYYLMFGVILDVSRGVDNFIAFLVVGIFVYHYSQKSVLAGAKSVANNEGLIRALQFPRAILPLSTVIGQSLAFLPAVGIMLVVAVLTGEMPHPMWLLLVPLFAIQATWNVGAAFVVARLTNRYRDVQQVLPYIFRLFFYLSGVLYSVDRFVPDEYTIFFDVNPFYVFITAARDLVLEETFTAHYWVAAIIWTLVLLVAGFWFFRNAEHEYGRG
jgi:teichoic acid transport system permease protein